METIITILELATMVVIVILCGICAWLYSLEIIKRIKRKFRPRA